MERVGERRGVKKEGERGKRGVRKEREVGREEGYRTGTGEE